MHYVTNPEPYAIPIVNKTLIAPALVVSMGYFPSLKQAADALALEVREVPFRNAVDLATGIETFAAEPNGGLFIHPATLGSGSGGATVLSLAVRHRLPAVNVIMVTAVEGVLISYGPCMDGARGAREKNLTISEAFGCGHVFGL
jgi:hypothetical protein